MNPIRAADWVAVAFVKVLVLSIGLHCGGSEVAAAMCSNSEAGA